MSTTTTTRTRSSSHTTRVKASSSSKSKARHQQDPAAELKSLYAPAARAFLRRDVVLTQALIDSAFTILDANPPVQSPMPDPFSTHRRKWDLLRITLETTLYASPPSDTSDNQSSSQSLPASLRSNVLLSPPSLLGSLHTRSIRLYTPNQPGPSNEDISVAPSPEFLPPQILLALVFASLKLHCAEIGRNMVEDWLARRVPPSEGGVELDGEDGYEKVIEAYCLQVLPALSEWEYASDFLRYEQELKEDKRNFIAASLQALHLQALNPPPPRTRRTPSSSSSTPVERPSSPALSSTSSTTVIPTSSINRTLSTSSSTSSISSTTSQETVMPVPRVVPIITGSTGPQPSSSSQNGQAGPQKKPSSSSALTTPTRSTFSRLPFAAPIPPSSSSSTTKTLTLFDTIRLRLANSSSSLLNALTHPRQTIGRGGPFIIPVVFLLISIIGFVMRLRRRKMMLSGGSSATGSSGAVGARKASVGGASGRSVLGREAGVAAARWLFEALRDTVVMAGKGLV